MQTFQIEGSQSYKSGTCSVDASLWLYKVYFM